MKLTTFQAIRRRINRRRTVHPAARCLLLHRVCAHAVPGWTATHRLTVTPSWFETLIADVAQRFTPLPLNQLVTDFHAGRPLPADAVAITFDDGYVDIATHVLPILKRHNVPATVFINSSFASHEAIPFEFALEHLIQHHRRLDDDLTGRRRSWNLNDCDDRQACFTTLSAELRPRPRHAQFDVLENLGNGECSFPEAQDFFLNWEQLRELRESGLIDLQAHGHEHLPMNRRSAESLVTDLQQHLRQFRRHLGTTPDLLAYPYGATSPQVERIAQRVGFRAAFTSQGGLINSAASPYALPRLELGAAHMHNPSLLPHASSAGVGQAA